MIDRSTPCPQTPLTQCSNLTPSGLVAASFSKLHSVQSTAATAACPAVLSAGAVPARGQVGARGVLGERIAEGRECAGS